MTQQNQLAKVSDYHGDWEQRDIDLIRRTVANGADDSEFKLLLYMANKYHLDPLIKQIWCIKYGNNPAAIYASRDGFLTIAHRSGQFDGMNSRAIKDDKGKPIGAVCEVWRKDMTHPFTIEVSRSEYDTGKGNWLKMPETMLKKVAESQCLRRAFDISGLYDPSEYDAEEERPAPQPARKRHLPPEYDEPAKPVEVLPVPGISITPEQVEQRVQIFESRLRGATGDSKELWKIGVDIAAEGFNEAAKARLKKVYNEVLAETERQIKKPSCPACDGPAHIDDDGMGQCESKGCGLIFELSK